jgi:hypothetical protein
MIIASLAASSTIVQASYTLILAPLYSPFIISFIQTYLKLKKRLRSILNIRGPTKKPITVATKVTNNHLEETEDNHRELETTQDLTEITSGEIVSEETIFSSVQDNQKRQFLKIIGGSGASLLMMLFFMPKQANAAFFGSTPGPGVVGVKDSSGNKIDPAEKKPTDGYSISELDDSSSPSYYGFVHKNGSWYISRESATGTYRYSKGSSDFSTNWTNRASLSYNTFDVVF